MYVASNECIRDILKILDDKFSKGQQSVNAAELYKNEELLKKYGLSTTVFMIELSINANYITSDKAKIEDNIIINSITKNGYELLKLANNPIWGKTKEGFGISNGLSLESMKILADCLKEQLI